MGQLVSFKIGDDEFLTKARIILEHSRKQICAVCGNKRWGVLVRHQAPKKIKDTLVCLECVVQISLGLPIQVDEKIKFGPYNKNQIINDAVRRPAKRLGAKRGSKQPKNTPCPHCGELFAASFIHLHIKHKHPEVVQVKPDAEPKVEPPAEPPDTVVIDEKPSEIPDSTINDAAERLNGTDTKEENGETGDRRGQAHPATSMQS